MKPTDKDRLMKAIEKRPNGCWIFSRGSHVYGRLAINGRQTLAHRASWILHRGPIPSGKQVLHNCPDGDNPRCVNPDHLWIGNHSQNVKDAIAKGRHWSPKGSENYLSKLNEESVLAIREGLKKGTFTIQQVADRYSISFQAIYQMALGNTWTHVGGPLLAKRVVRNLSVDEVLEIRRLAREGTKGIDIAAKFGIHPATASDIINRKRRRDVP